MERLRGGRGSDTHAGEVASSGDRLTEGLTPDQKALLEHPGRRGLIALLRRAPGLNKNSLAQALGEYPNTIEYHLQKLEEAGLVTIRKGEQGREKVCFLPGQEHLWEDDRTRILFGRRPVREIALYIAENAGATSRRIAQAVDLSPITVRHHLETLSNYDLIDRQRAGRSFHYQAQPSLNAWVEEVGQGYDRPWLRD